jgi:hypothetical protein
MDESYAGRNPHDLPAQTVALSAARETVGDGRGVMWG